MMRALVLLAAFAGAAQASEITLNASRRGEAVEISAVALMRADAARAWRVLTGYDRYAEFIPDLISSRTVTRDGDRVVVDQRGNARFLWMNEPVAVRLEVIETPPAVVESRLLSGSVRELRGRYELVAGADASVKLLYTGRIVLGDDAAGFLDLFAVRANVSRQFAALVREIERVAAPRPDADDRPNGERR